MLSSILRRLNVTGLRRGLAGSRGWLYLGVAAGGLRILRRLAREGDEVLFRTQVRDGDVFEILASRPTRGRSRQKAG